MISEQIVHALSWISWGGILAGSVAALAISVLMAIFGVALGFTVVDPKSDDPTSGLGAAFGTWSFISVLVSMAGGGFIAGLAAGQHGVEHGFLVWALVVLVATCVSGIAAGSAMRLVGSTVKSLGSGATEVVSSVGKMASQAVGSVVGELRDSVNLDIDSEKLTREITDVLRDTGIETLQPDYLRQQMREARSDLRKTLHQLSLEPGKSEQIISAFLQEGENRINRLAQSIDRESAVQAVMQVRHIPRNEAEQIVDNAIRLYDQTLCKVRETLAEAREQVGDAGEYMKNMARQAREKADHLTTTAARAALAAGIALIIAAGISMGAAAWGANHTADWFALQDICVIR